MKNLMKAASGINRENTINLPGWGPEDWIEPGCSLAKVCSLKNNKRGGLNCTKNLAKKAGTIDGFVQKPNDGNEDVDKTDCRLS